MAKPFKFRYVNEIAGSFVLLVALSLIAGIVLAGNAQRWFETVYRITLLFPPEGTFGLQIGAEVQILGTRVGSVDEISVNENGSMSGEITVRGNFIRFVREDSKAIVKKKFAVAGDAFVEITKGTGTELSRERPELKCTKDTEILEILQQVVDQVRSAVLPAIEQARVAVEEYTKVAAELHNPEGNLQQLLGNLNRLAAGLEKGEGTAGSLLKDPSLANELKEITTLINENIAKVNGILEDIKQTTKGLPKMAETLGGEVDDLPGIVLQTQETLRESTKLIEGLQKHWLIRKYVEQGAAPSTRIPLSQLPADGGGAP